MYVYISWSSSNLQAMGEQNQNIKVPHDNYTVVRST